MTSSKYSIPFSGVTIEATVTNEASAINEWVTQILSQNLSERIIVGLDCEWLPNTTPNSNHKTATLQLCVDTKCLIVQLFHVDYIPDSLNIFLGHIDVTCVGIEVADDVSKLRSEYGLVIGRASDIQAIAMERDPINLYRKPGLKRLALKLVGLRMEKPLHVCRSNWEIRVLSYKQVEYACIDAYASYRIGRKLLLERADPH